MTRRSPVEARFFRFVALHDIDDGGWVSAAEVTVVPAPGQGLHPRE